MPDQLDDFPEIVPYASVDFSKDFLGRRASTRVFWMSLADDLTADPSAPFTKLMALQEATEHVDQLTYVGEKLVYGQERKWPRLLDYGTEYSTVYYLQNRLPMEVAMATCYQAYYIAWNAAHFVQIDNRLDMQMQGVTGVSRAGGNENWDLNKARRHSLCPKAMELLRNWIAKTGNLESGHRSPVT